MYSGVHFICTNRVAAPLKYVLDTIVVEFVGEGEPLNYETIATLQAAIYEATISTLRLLEPTQIEITVSFRAFIS